MPTNKKEYDQRYYQEHKEELKKAARAWYWEHKEYCSQRAKEYHQKHRDERIGYQRRTVLTTRDKNGEQVTVYGLNKRPFPNYCELCKVENIKLNYHHWDDNNYSKGIWLCFKCHILAEMAENGMPIGELIKKYSELKCKIEIG